MKKKFTQAQLVAIHDALDALIDELSEAEGELMEGQDFSKEEALCTTAFDLLTNWHDYFDAIER
jgi:hypothetical protein